MTRPQQSTISPQAAEVKWYRAHGRYQQRIRLDNRGNPYVIGDYGWNLNNAERHEEIESRMLIAQVYLPLSISKD